MSKKLKRFGGANEKEVLQAIEEQMNGHLDLVPVDKLVPNPNNPRIDLAEENPKLKTIMESLRRHGLLGMVVWNQRTGHLVGGHQRLKVLKSEGKTAVPAIVIDVDEKDENEKAIALNFAVGLWDVYKLAAQKQDLEAQGADLGYMDLEELLPALGDEVTADKEAHKKLVDAFVVPPFTVLDMRQGYWKERKAAWLSLGIKSEIGRKDEKGLIHTLGSARQTQIGQEEVEDWTTISIFDPVLCEIVYRWFCPAGGAVLDPFAGGSVRGIVAAALGHVYYGVDLRKEQVEANEQQWKDIGARLAGKAEADNQPELTPVDKHGDYWMKRDDLYRVAGVCGGKVRTCWNLAQGAKGLVTAGSRSSPQCNIVAHIAQKLGGLFAMKTKTEEGVEDNTLTHKKKAECYICGAFQIKRRFFPLKEVDKKTGKEMLMILTTGYECGWCGYPRLVDGEQGEFEIPVEAWEYYEEYLRIRVMDVGALSVRHRELGHFVVKN